MLVYYKNYNLKYINQYIIKNQIIPLSKNSKTQNHKFHILTENQIYLHNIKKQLLHKSQAIQLNPLMTKQIFYKTILKTIIINYTKNYNLINQTNKTILIKEIIDKYKNKTNDKYLNKILNHNKFQQELLSIIKTIKQQYISQNNHPYIIDIKHTLSKWTTQITQKYPKLTEKYNTITNILNSYIEKQKKYSLVDNEDIIHIIKNSIEKEKIPPVESKTIYILGIHSLSNLEIKLLNTLAKTKINIIITIYFDTKRKEIFYKGNRLIQKLKEINFKEKSINNNTNKKINNEYNTLNEIKSKLFTEKISTIDTNNNNYPIWKIEGKNPKDEIIKVTKQIKYILNNNTKPNKIAIIDKNPNEYQDHIYDTLKQYNIPLNNLHSKNLINKKLIQIILSIIELKLYNFKENILLPFISSNYTYINKELINNKLHKGFNTNKIVENILYYYNNPNKDIFPYFEELLTKTKKEENKQKENSITHCLTYLNTLKELICLLPNNKSHIYEIIKTLKTLITSSFSILYNIYKNNDLEIIKEDALTLKNFFYLLDELSFIHTKKENTTINLKTFYELLKETITNYSFTNKENNNKAVYYSKPNNILNLSFPYIFVIGMTEANFPSKIKQNTLFSNLEKKIINKTTPFTFPSTDELINDEDFSFLNTINAATKQIFLSYHKRNNKLKETLPSFYFDEIKTKKLKPINEINSLNELYELYGKITLTENTDLDKNFDKNLIPEKIKKLIHNKAKMEYTRNKPNSFSNYEGILSAKEILSANIIDKKLNYQISPTQLERYGKCPQRFFFHDILKLRKEKNNTDTLEPLSKGSAVHHILYTFYKNNPNTNTDKYLNTNNSLHKKVKEEITNITKKYFAKQIKERKLNHLYHNSKEIQIIINKILSFLKKDILNSKNYKPHLLELNFNFAKENNPIITYKEKNIYIKGIIDRIDIEKEQTNRKIRIIDYKSSSAKDNQKTIQNKLKEGLYFQPIIYTKAALNLLKNYTLDKWYYYYVTPNKPNKTKIDATELNPFDKIEKENKENYITRTLYYINQYLKLIGQGQFPLNPRDCKNCEFEYTCRVNIPLSKEKEQNTGFWKNIIPDNK